MPPPAAPSPYAPSPAPAPYAPSPAPAPYAPSPAPAPVPAAFQPFRLANNWQPVPGYVPSAPAYVPPPAQPYAPSPSPSPYAPSPSPYAPSPSPSPSAPLPVPPVLPPSSVNRPVDPAAAQSARQRAEAIWINRQNLGDKLGGHVEADPISVNKLDANRQARASAEIQQNQAAEQRSRAALDPARQQQYDAVAAAIQGDPNARLALQVLLIEGALPGKANPSDGRDVLGGLAALTSQPLAGGMSRADLLGDMVQEIALPSAINQWDRGTCTVTSIQILMAMKRPAEYVRVVAGLASPQGQVRLANGDTLNRLRGTDVSDGTQRTISSRLWQPALMQYATPRQTYTNQESSDGLTYQGVDRVLTGVTGQKPTTYWNGRGWNLDQVMAALKASTDRGVPVTIGADFQGRFGHEVLVTRVANGRVYYHNPQGTEDSIDEAQFRRYVDSVHIANVD